MGDYTFVTREKFDNLIRITLSKIKRSISKLKAKGLLERIGADKDGYSKMRILCHCGQIKDSQLTENQHNK